MSKFDERGHELPDPTPVEVPLGFKRPPTLQEEIMRFVRREMSLMADAQGFETFEESDDFDVDDEGLPFSPHELTPAQEERIFRRDASDLEANSESGHGKRSGEVRTDEGGNSADSVGAEVRRGRRETSGGEAVAAGRSDSAEEARPRA